TSRAIWPGVGHSLAEGSTLERLASVKSRDHSWRPWIERNGCMVDLNRCWHLIRSKPRKGSRGETGGRREERVRESRLRISVGIRAGTRAERSAYLCIRPSPEALEIRRADPSASGRVLHPDGAAPRRPGRRLSGRTTDSGRGRRLLGAALQLRRRGAAAAERAVRRGVPAAGGMDHGTRPGLPPRRRQRLTSALAHFNHNVRLVWNRAGNSADWS